MFSEKGSKQFLLQKSIHCLFSVDANKEAAEPRVLLNGSIESHHLEGFRVVIMT
jgi:hypothetical protein